LSLIRIEKEKEDIRDSIKPIQVSLNPNFLMIAGKNFHSILSKAFYIFILRNINPFWAFPFLVLESMEQFMSKDSVILNVPTRHKSGLKRRDYLSEPLTFLVIACGFCQYDLDC
jgi:hypothetical protein